MARKDDDSSMLLYFDATVERPKTAHTLKDVRLLALNAPVTAEMLRISRKWEISEDGKRLGAKRPRNHATNDLTAWLHQIGSAIATLGLGKAALDALNPLPPGMPPSQMRSILTSHDAPNRDAMLHLLWSLGISPHAITAAVLLLEHASSTQDTSKQDRRSVAVK